jgi:hypothetical protein
VNICYAACTKRADPDTPTTLSIPEPSPRTRKNAGCGITRGRDWVEVAISKTVGRIETTKYRGAELLCAAVGSDFRTAMIHATITGLEEDEPADEIQDEAAAGRRPAALSVLCTLGAQFWRAIRVHKLTPQCPAPSRTARDSDSYLQRLLRSRRGPRQPGSNALAHVDMLGEYKANVNGFHFRSPTLRLLPLSDAQRLS